MEFAKQLESVESRFQNETESIQQKPILKGSNVLIRNVDPKAPDISWRGRSSTGSREKHDSKSPYNSGRQEYRANNRFHNNHEIRSSNPRTFRSNEMG